MTDDQSSYAGKSVTLLAIGLLIFTLFQLTQVVLDRVSLSKAKAQIEQNTVQVDKALDDGSKMIDKLNEVAIATQKLAEAGNANAKEIVTQLNKAGIKINPNFKKGQPQPGQPGAAGTGAPAAPAAAPAAPAPAGK